jgi:hypothetical protein
MTADHSARTGQRRGDEERGKDRIAKLVYTVARSTPKKPSIVGIWARPILTWGSPIFGLIVCAPQKKATDDCVQGETFVCG